MSFLDRLRPKWNHSDPVVRKQAVADLDDQAVLEKIVAEDSDESVRLAAVGRLTDQELLSEIACGNTSLAVAALRRLTDRRQIVRTAQAAASGDVRVLAVERIEDGAVLHRIAASDPDARVRQKARTRSPWPDPARDHIRRRLAGLPVGAPTAEFAEACSGTLDAVCGALIGDGRFSINGAVEQHDEASVPVGDPTMAPFQNAPGLSPAAETFAQFLAFKRGAGGEPTAKGPATDYFQIKVWRTEPDFYRCCIQEKRLETTHNALVWSRSSSGTAHPGRAPEHDGAGGNSPS